MTDRTKCLFCSAIHSEEDLGDDVVEIFINEGELTPVCAHHPGVMKENKKAMTILKMLRDIYGKKKDTDASESG